MIIIVIIISFLDNNNRYYYLIFSIIIIIIERLSNSKSSFLNFLYGTNIDDKRNKKIINNYF